MEKPLPAEVAILIPRAVAMQAEAEEAERSAMEAIRGDARLPNVGQEDRAAADPQQVTTGDLAASDIEQLARVAARWGGKASYDKPEAPLTEAGMKSASLEDRAYALTQLNRVVNFHKKYLCFGRGAPSVGPSAPINPFAPGQVDESRGFRTSENPRKMTYNLVVSDGKRDYLADRLEISQEMRASGLVPPEARTCQIVVPTKSRMGEYVPGYEPGVVATIAGRETGQAMMKMLTSDFDGLVINSKRASDLFEDRVLKETGQPGNWVNIDQVVWFLKEIVGTRRRIGRSSTRQSRLSRPGRLRSW